MAAPGLQTGSGASMRHGLLPRTRSSAAYREYLNKYLDVARASLVMDVVDFLFERLGGLP
jgi:hypothetical protein